jgi:hypothetical protein
MATVARWFLDSAGDDPDLEWGGLDERVQSAGLDTGDPDDPDRPLDMIIRYASGITAQPHSHESDSTSLVAGEVEVTGRHGPGSPRLVARATVYGPLVAGPEGTTIILTFTNRNGLFPEWAKRSDADDERRRSLRQYLARRLARVEPRPRRDHRAVASL